MKSKIVESIFLSGQREDMDFTEKGRVAILNTVCLVGVTNMIRQCFKIIELGDFKMLAVTGSATVLSLVIYFVHRFRKNLETASLLNTFLIFILFQGLISVSGVDKTGLIWMQVFPLISFFLCGLKKGLIITVFFSALAMFQVAFLTPMRGYTFNPEFLMKAFGAYTIITILTFSFELIKNRTQTSLLLVAQSLSDKKTETDAILHNVRQGIFLLDKEQRVSSECSEYFREIFPEFIENQKFADLLKGKIQDKDFTATMDFLDMFFNDTINPDLLTMINPLERIELNLNKGDLHSAWLEFTFEKITLKNGDINILGVFKDITERIILEGQLEQEAAESSRKMENLFQIIHVNPLLMHEFIQESEDEIARINALLQSETDDTARMLNHIFQSVHSIKGNAVLLGLTSLGNKLHDFEEYIKDLQDKNSTWKELLHLAASLAEVKHNINEINELIEKILQFQATSSREVTDRKLILENSILKSIKKLTSDKDCSVQLDLSDFEISLLSQKYRRLLKDVLSQFIRNSIAHGIETEAIRVASNKSPAGTIKISLEKNQNDVTLTFADDGRGLDQDRIRKVAIEKKGFNPAEVHAMRPSDIIKLIFHPGFSTTAQADQLSGQGVGMNIVKRHVDKAGGKISIRSAAGKFCEFKISLPH